MKRITKIENVALLLKALDSLVDLSQSPEYPYLLDNPFYRAAYDSITDCYFSLVKDLNSSRK